MREKLEESGELSNRQTFTVMLRALRYVEPFRWQFGVKTVLLLISLLPLLILPWPIKILIDHVIEEVPIDQPIRPYPPFLQPAMDALVGMSTTEILFWVVAVQALIFLPRDVLRTARRSSRVLIVPPPTRPHRAPAAGRMR